jgi:hypothetical protein
MTAIATPIAFSLLDIYVEFASIIIGLAIGVVVYAIAEIISA